MTGNFDARTYTYIEAIHSSRLTGSVLRSIDRCVTIEIAVARIYFPRYIDRALLCCAIT